ncbi:MAG: M23 family metallopeptidase [Spirochaetes bacterium]|nr:M23 family metallopeptidase [Spirochaetota bacterium]
MFFDKEKIFTIFILIFSIFFLILSFYLTKIKSEALLLKLNEPNRILNLNIKGINYNFNMLLDLNKELDIENIGGILKTLKLNKNEILNIYPRIKANIKLKGEFAKNIYTFFEWEIPPSFFQNIKFGEPIKNYTFRYDSAIYPGAPRYYRHGIHRGFDFSDREDGSIATINEPVKVVYPGIIVNIKKDYEAYSDRFKFEIYRKITAENNYTDDIYLDFFRGNQVYIINGSILFIYAHLNKVNENIKIGDKVKVGDIVGYMGNTGVEYMGVRPHLHLEIYINGMVFGINRLRRTFENNFELYKYLFSKY